MKKLKFNGKNLHEGKSFVGEKFSNKMKYGPNFINKKGEVIELRNGDVMIKDNQGNISLE